MQIERWMTKQVQTARPRDSIEHAREIMEKHRVNQLPVVVDRHVVGIVTDRDLRDAFPSVFSPQHPHGRKAVPAEGTGSDPEKVIVEMVMTPNVITLSPRDTMAAAAELMRSERIGAIPIVDGKQLAGILTRSDILDAYVDLARTSASEGSPETTSEGSPSGRPTK